MTVPALLTLAVLAVALVAMMASLATPDVALLGAVVGLAALGVLTPADALAGFGNPGMITIAALFVVATGLRETGAIALFTGRLLGRPRTARGALVRLVPPVVAASAFLNNTTVVASLLPAVNDWARRLGVPASRLLMPLSFASILGGVCTLVGTSTNLVVAGLVEERVGHVPGLHDLGMFGVSLVGVPVALAGAGLLVLLGPVLLPDRRPAVSPSDDPRRYAMELLVPSDSRLVGRTIEEADLRALPGAFLMEIVRERTVIPAVDAQRRLEGGDRLVFVGDIDAMLDLQRIPGLAAAPDQAFKLEGDRDRRQIVEAVVSQRNPLVGRTIRDGQFRNRYHAVVIAVAHAGERVPGRIGDIVLRAGDVLMLEAHPDFLTEQRTRTDFYLVSQVEGAAPPRLSRAPLALATLAAMVALATLGLVPTVLAALLAAGAMIAFRCCTLDEARRALDLQVLMAIAAAFGLGRALEVTGLDALLAGLAFDAGASSPLAALVAVYVTTAVVTELVTNNAAAVLCLPLALSLATRLGVSPTPFVYAVMIAASASFLTPIGYQTNLMVFGPGGYRAVDYPRLGLPLAVATATITVLLTPLVWPF